MATVANPQDVREYFLCAAAAGCGESVEVALRIADLVAPQSTINKQVREAEEARVEDAYRRLSEKEDRVRRLDVPLGVARVWAGLNTTPETDDHPGYIPSYKGQ